MYKRCKKILEVAIVNNSKGIVLGAFGCGIFKNRCEDVVDYFKKLLYDEKYLMYFDKVVFAIPGNKNKFFNHLINSS